MRWESILIFASKNTFVLTADASIQHTMQPKHADIKGKKRKNLSYQGKNLRIRSKNLRLKCKNLRLISKNLRYQGKNLRIRSKNLRLKCKNLSLISKNLSNKGKNLRKIPCICCIRPGKVEKAQLDILRVMQWMERFPKCPLFMEVRNSDSRWN